jgi:hypothetical protein
MKITRRYLRKIIKEEIQREAHGRPEDRARGNQAPPRGSNWRSFADALDIGVLDLDEIAYELGFRDFLDMDISISPSRLADRDPRKFVMAVQSHSLAGEAMSRDQILTYAAVPGGM